MSSQTNPDRASRPQIPEALIDGDLLPATRGFFDGEWFVEEGNGAVRFGVRVEGLLHEEQSRFQKISVYESAFLGRMLVLDDTLMLAERDEFVYHEMLVHVPLLSIPEPTSVLIIGGGDCGCLREVLKHDCVERVVQCDIDERVTDVCSRYFSWVNEARSDSRAELVYEDGATFLDKSAADFDLVIVDSTDPRDMAVGLFLRRFYRRVSTSLKSGGVMAAQTESPHWNAGMVGAIYAEIAAAFREVSSYLGMVPTYPSGCWSFAYASESRLPADFFDAARAESLAGTCLYYRPGLEKAVFVLPGFAADAIEGKNPFEGFDRRLYRSVRQELPSGGRGGGDDEPPGSTPER